MHRIPNLWRLSLEPDELIGAHKMRRHWLIPRNRFLFAAIHVHVGDDELELHDHPADNLSIRIRGQLIEYTPDVPPRTSAARPGRWPFIRNPEGSRVVYYDAFGETFETGRALPRLKFRTAEDAHRLQVCQGPSPVTLWIRFRIRRRWGFFSQTGWRVARTARQPAP